MLATADPLHSYTLYSDASDFAIGGMLSQEQPDGTFLPVVFHFRKLEPAKIN